MNSKTRAPPPRQEALADVDLKLVFIAKKGRSLTREKILKRIDLATRRVTSHPEWPKYCHRIYDQLGDDTSPFICTRPLSIVNFFDKDFFVGVDNPSYDVYPTDRNRLEFVQPSKLFNESAKVETDDLNLSDENIAQVTKFWAEYGEGVILNGDGQVNDSGYGYGVYEGEQLPAKFYFKREDGEQSSLANLFEIVADSKFGESPRDTKVEAGLVVLEFWRT